MTVYNEQYQLTHLLENGHDIIINGEVRGHAAAHVHIAPVEAWAQDEFPEVPYVTYTCHADNNFFADDKVYQKIRSMRAVLYSTKKDEKLETLIESALDEAEIPWNMTDEFENEQKVFMTIYEAEVI